MFKSQKLTLKYEKPENICLNEVNKIMAKYKFCIIKGLVKPSEITVPMKKLKRYIRSNKDLPGIGEDPKKARGFLMKFVSRIRSTNLTGVTSVVKRDIYNPLHKYVGGWDLIVKKND